MSGPALKMLLIEDDLPVAELIAAMLRKTKDMAFEVTVAGDLQSGLRCLETNVIDAIFLDLTLPDSNGLETITKVQAKAPAVPIIVLTGIDDEALASHAVREGAQDYIVKGHVDITMLVRSVRYAVERKRAQEALRNARDELELRVQERTAELLRVNESLKKEIEERKHAERAAQVLNLKLKETQAQLIQAAK
ncbi:MAG: response regulator, partial [Saprospiraceae bacterium]|nr:response regulator [Saprospiraceae bacterium]